MKSNWAKRWGIILILLGFAIGIPGVWLLIAHPHYEATTRIELSNQPDIASGIEIERKLSYDPYFIQTEFEVIQSQIVLNNVVTKLQLDTEWGKRYANGRKLELTETVDLLKQCLRLRLVRNTLLIEIGVISEDAAEAAKIANAIAEAYRDLQEEHIPKLSVVRIVDPARPDSSPLGPNRPLGQALLGVGVLLLVCGFVVFVRNWRRPDEAAS
jgi:uncharacterized protein involved in exopolysaccharide biosynthesis